MAQQIATGRIGARQATALETSAANASKFTPVEIDNGIHAPLGERTRPPGGVDDSYAGGLSGDCARTVHESNAFIALDLAYESPF